jgi:hypothetical protein
MAAFRRVVFAFALLAAFAGLASAQMSCSPNSSNGNAFIRGEGKSELIGDLVLFCTGGSPTQGSLAPQVNITVTLPQALTSKQLGTAVSGYTPTEALLVMDDSNVVVDGAPPTVVASPNFCATTPTVTSSTCQVFQQISQGGGFVPSSRSGGFSTTAASLNNVFQGFVNTTSTPNQVTFFGVPVVPPGSTGQRTFRIVNLRENTSAGSSGAVVAQVGAVNTSGSGAQQITFTGVTQTLGNVQPSLTVTASRFSLVNCNALNWAFAGTLSFAQAGGFSNAFKTRQLPNATVPAAGSAQSATPTPQQATATNAAGSTSESGYALVAGGNTFGLADYVTRLKAVFNNIPSGARVFVSFANVTGASTILATPGTTSAIYQANAAITGPVGNTNTTPLAELLLSGAETLPDSGGSPLLATPNSLTATQISTNPGLTQFAGQFAELTVSGGSATAVWEVLNTASTASFVFDVFVTLPAQGSTGTGVVNLSYAPTITTLTVPAFVDPNAASPQSVIAITQCRSVLLFPYVTSFGGFDTGVAVANTTTDIYGTAAQTGTCSATLYGDPSPAPTVPAAAWSVNGGAPSASIASGHVGAFAISQYAPGFTGYMIAVCNFQFAHGFAFVADWGNPNYSSAMGYLALQLTPGTLRLAAGPSFTNAETLVQ